MGVYTAPRSVLLPTTLIIKVVIHHMHLVQRLRQLTTSLRPHSRPPGAVTRPLSRFGPRLKYAVIPVTRAGVGRCTWRTLPENHVNIIYTAPGAATTMRNDRSRPYNGSNAPSRRSKSIGTIGPRVTGRSYFTRRDEARWRHTQGRLALKRPYSVDPA